RKSHCTRPLALLERPGRLPGPQTPLFLIYNQIRNFRRAPAECKGSGFSRRDFRPFLHCLCRRQAPAVAILRLEPGLSLVAEPYSGAIQESYPVGLGIEYPVAPRGPVV